MLKTVFVLFSNPIPQKKMFRKNLFWFWFLNSISQKKKIKKIFLLPSVFIFTIPFWFFTFFHFLLFSIFHPVAFLCFCKKIWDHFNENQFMKNSLKMFLFFCSFKNKDLNVKVDNKILLFSILLYNNSLLKVFNCSFHSFATLKSTL